MNIFETLGGAWKKARFAWNCRFDAQTAAIQWLEGLAEGVDASFPLAKMTPSARVASLGLLAKASSLRGRRESGMAWSISEQKFEPMKQYLEDCSRGKVSMLGSFFGAWLEGMVLGNVAILPIPPLYGDSRSERKSVDKNMWRAVSIASAMPAEQWEAACQAALAQIIEAMPGRDGLCAGLLVMCAARPKGDAWTRIVELCKQDEELSEAIVEAALASATRTGGRLFASQAVVADEASQAHWRSMYTRESEALGAWRQSAWSGYFFLKASERVLDWGVQSDIERPSRPCIETMLDLAKSLSGGASLAWKAAVENKPQAVVGLALWGQDLDSAGPDGLRPVDIATRQGRALLYRALALGGADCETKGRGSRKSPAELGKKLLREDLGSDLLSAAERAEIASCLALGPKPSKGGLAKDDAADIQEGEGLETARQATARRPRL